MMAQKRNWGAIGMSLFLAFIMVASIAGFLITDTGNTSSRYKGTKFTLGQQGWDATVNGKPYTFAYLPQDVEGIALPANLNANVAQIDITSSANSTAAGEIAQEAYRLTLIGMNSEIYVRNAFNAPNPYGLPVISCENATAYIPVLQFQLGPKHEIRQEGNCVIIESNAPFGFRQLTDRIAYSILGVIP